MSKFLNISTDSTLGGNNASNEVVPSQKAVKDYVDNGVSANKDLSNLTSQGQNIANWSTNVTNCITEIPQDVILELSGTTLTLKAGSKVYVPNGFEQDGTTLKFTEIVTTSDISYSTWGSTSTDLMVFYNAGALAAYSASIYSGSTQPTSAGLWYDTTNNYMKYSSNGTSWAISNHALPLGLVGRNSGTPTAIHQLFNGFGYIGSTWFLLPNVKFSVTYKRNEDGSYKTYIINNSSIKTLTRTSGALSNWTLCTSIYNYEVYDIHYELNCYVVNSLPSSGTTYTSYFNMQDGLPYYTSSGTTPNLSASPRIKLVENCSCDSSGKITASGKFLLPFTGALSINDSSIISGWGMPSTRYIDLTLGATDTNYTALANGYVMFQKNTTAAAQAVHIYLRNEDNTANMAHVELISTGSNQYLAVMMPVKMGKLYRVSYTAAGTSSLLRFIYAEGEN